MSTIAPSKVFYAPEDSSRAVVQTTGQAELCHAAYSSGFYNFPLLYLAFDLPVADRKKYLKNVSVSVPFSFSANRARSAPAAISAQMLYMTILATRPCRIS